MAERSSGTAKGCHHGGSIIVLVVSCNFVPPEREHMHPGGFISATGRLDARYSSGSSCAESAVVPTKSQNITVNCRRSPSVSRGLIGRGSSVGMVSCFSVLVTFCFLPL